MNVNKHIGIDEKHFFYINLVLTYVNVDLTYSYTYPNPYVG